MMRMNLASGTVFFRKLSGMAAATETTSLPFSSLWISLRTFSSSPGLTTMKIMSDWAAAFLLSDVAVTPSASIALTRSCTASAAVILSLKPAFMRLVMMAPPIIPVPITAILFGVNCSPLVVSSGGFCV